MTSEHHVSTDLRASHTPGPWTIGRTGSPSTLAIFRTTPTARELVGRFADHTVGFADVRLMSAAPDLLALARQYASECANCGGTGLVTRKYEWRGAECDADDQPCPDCQEIRDVLAKATGL